MLPFKPRSDVAPEALLKAFQARGIETSDWSKSIDQAIRFGAHEAHHALAAGMPKRLGSARWDSDGIHEALVRHAKNRSGLITCGLVAEELDARAVEQVVCQKLGLDAGPIEHWAGNVFFETFKTIQISLNVPWIVDQIKNRLASRPNLMERYADRVVDLGKKRRQ